MTKKKNQTTTKSKQKGIQAFKKFVDFMHENPQLMQKFPQKIIFSDGVAKVEFAK